MFHAINTSAKRAERRNSEVISAEDAQRALSELETSLTRRIEKNDYGFLLNIYNGNKEMIEDKEMLLKMLQASAVLEYNGKRWRRGLDVPDRIIQQCDELAFDLFNFAEQPQ